MVRESGAGETKRSGVACPLGGAPSTLVRAGAMPALTARRSIGIEKEVCEPVGAVCAWVAAKASEAWPAREVEVEVVAAVAASGCDGDDKVAGLDCSSATQSQHTVRSSLGLIKRGLGRGPHSPADISVDDVVKIHLHRVGRAGLLCLDDTVPARTAVDLAGVAVSGTSRRLGVEMMIGGGAVGVGVRCGVPKVVG